MAQLSDRFTIVGGGYTGLVLALYLTENGFRNIEVLDSGDELQTLQKAHMFTVRRAPAMHSLADILGISLDEMYFKGIEFKNWIGLKEEVPDFVFETNVSDERYTCGLVNPGTIGPALLNLIRSRGVNVSYNTGVAAEQNSRGQRLVASSSQGDREIHTDYLFDATNFGLVLRNLRDNCGKPLLNDDPRICDLLCLRVPGSMRADYFMSIFGPDFGPFSWMAPSSCDPVNPQHSITIDAVASRFCYLSERNEQILAGRLRNLLLNSATHPVFQRAGAGVANLEEIANMSNDELAASTNMKGIYRMEPTQEIQLDSAPYVARKGVFLVGNAAGWGDPTSANIFYASLQIIKKLASMLRDNQENSFFNWWRHHSAINYDFSMAFQQSRMKPDQRNSGRRLNFVLSVNALPEEAKFMAITGSEISWPNKLRLMKGNFLYLSELFAKAYLPFRIGYALDGGYCYGKSMESSIAPVTFGLARRLSKETRPYGY